MSFYLFFEARRPWEPIQEEFSSWASNTSQGAAGRSALRQREKPAVHREGCACGLISEFIAPTREGSF